MISLPTLEEPPEHRLSATENGPQVADEGIELPQGRHVVLFTTAAITLREANARLAHAGFRGAMPFNLVRLLEKVPVLGTRQDRLHADLNSGCP